MTALPGSGFLLPEGKGGTDGPIAEVVAAGLASGSPDGSGGGSRPRRTRCPLLNTRLHRQASPVVQEGKSWKWGISLSYSSGLISPGEIPLAECRGSLRLACSRCWKLMSQLPSFQVSAGVCQAHHFRSRVLWHVARWDCGTPCHRTLKSPTVCTVAKSVQTSSQRKTHASKGIEQQKKPQNPTPNFVSGLGSP